MSMRRLRLHIWLLLVFLVTAGATLLWQPPALLPSFDVTKLFEIGTIKSDKDVPKELRDLDGRRVIVRGQLLDMGNSPATLTSWVKASELVNPQRAQDRVFLNLQTMTTQPSKQILGDDINVYGIFHVQVEQDEKTGAVLSVFKMDAEQILPYSPQDIPSPPAWVSVAWWVGIVGAGISLFIPLTAFLNASFAQKRRTKQGLCRHCGYDLRATPDQCPECGRPARDQLPNYFDW